MRNFIISLITLLLGACATAQPAFVFAIIEDQVMPIERGSKYEDPLDSILKRSNLGEVTGGGSQLAAGGGIQWVGVDIEVTDIKKSIPLITETLKKLGAPKGSRLEYRINGELIVVPIHDR